MKTPGSQDPKGLLKSLKSPPPNHINSANFSWGGNRQCLFRAGRIPSIGIPSLLEKSMWIQLRDSKLNPHTFHDAACGAKATAVTRAGAE